MKTKIIPFDLETAKKIQAGEIQGKIKTGPKEADVTIISFCRKSPFSIVGLIGGYIVETYDTNGYSEDYANEVTPHRLCIEVPDNEQQLNVGDTVSINIINSCFYDADFRARYHSKLATVLFTNKYGAGVKTISGDENYFTFDELIFVRRDAKDKFKPFEKILVRNTSICNDNSWHAAYYSNSITIKDTCYHVTTDGMFYIDEDIIPYEGNEHLLGTSDEPKED